MKKSFYVLMLAALGCTALTQDSQAQTTIFGSPRAQVETHIAVNPTDPNNLIGTAITQLSDNQIGYYYSFNGGQSWNGGENLSGTVGAGDPVIAFDPDGTAYLLYQIITASGLYLVKSSDGGVTWSSPTTVFQIEPTEGSVDRPWMAISPIRNANGKFDVYVSHTLYLDPPQFGVPTPSDIKLRKSTDGGMYFSEIPTAPAASDFVQGSSVAVGPSGEVFLAWAELSSVSTAVTSIVMERSTDGGSTFSSLNTVTAYQIGAKSGNDFTLKTPKIRVDSYPRLAIDTSPGIYRGYAYVIWAGKQSSSGNPDILIVRWKKNAGGNFEWSGVEIVDQATSEQWMPAISVSPDDVVSTLYYSSQTGDSDPIFTYLKTSTNGGQSFSGVVNVGTATGFTIEPTGNTFLGDYHGVASWFGKANALWCENRNHGSNNKRQAYFRTVTVTEVTPTGYQYVTVDQIDESNQPFEKFGRWNQNAFTNYKAPFRFLFQTNANEIIRAKQDFKTGTTQKYNKWDADNNVVNHRTFTITSGLIALKAQFKNANNATIRTELIDGGSGGNVEFRDPWLIDDSDSYGPKNRGQVGALWYTKPSPFSPNTNTNYKGVLSNQTVPSGVYYSARALLSQTINSFTWLFQNWSATGATFQQVGSNPPGYDEKAVVFTTANAEVKARLKAHLGSNNPVATGSNGQRKIVYEPVNAKFHFVYDSGGEIYYSVSTDNGVTWSNEAMISAGNGNSRYPAIVAFKVATNEKIYVIWQRNTGGNNYTIYFRRNTGSGWGSILSLGTISSASALNPFPVITLKEVSLPGNITKTRLVACWKSSSALRFRYSDDEGATWATEASVPSTSSTHRDPSLAAGGQFDYAYENGYLTYDNDSVIYLRKYHTDDIQDTTGWQAPEIVPGSSGTSALRSQVIIDHTGLNHANIVWQGYDPNSLDWAVFYQRKSGFDNSWSAVQCYVGIDYQQPTITHLSSSQNLAMLWDNFQDTFKATYTHNTNSWSVSPQNVGSGGFANLSAAFGRSHPAGKYVRTSFSGLPFSIQVSAETLQKTVASTNSAYHRRVVVADTADAVFFVDLGEVYFRSKTGVAFPLNFVAVDDTLLTLPPESFWSYLETAPTAITDEVDSLVAEVVVYSQNPSRLFAAGKSALSLRFDLVDGSDGKAVTGVGTQQLLRQSGKLSLRAAAKISSLAGRNVILHPVIQGVASGRKDFQYSLIHVHYNGVLSKLAQPGTSKPALGDVVAAYRLHQNYPNPFNPTTTIRYSIPKESRVSLKMYDLQGNEVATLVDGLEAAGNYHVEFNGAVLGSGVYLCRLQAGNVSQIIKLTLLK